MAHYKLDTKHGLLNPIYSIFTPSLDDVVQEREVSLREVATAESTGQGQGFAKCSCTVLCDQMLQVFKDCFMQQQMERQSLFLLQDRHTNA